ncbi:MFS transporter [Tolypocladium paradoxum]|uniref:MFS transporter n=1 Tax=Tolypocladium paradoxum TaxID=94208 RepID=A0A2S4LAR4_9HYPO|nr:MFS transporter [Tolypocladium paradoxum]
MAGTRTWRSVFGLRPISKEALGQPYEGSGSDADPFLVQWTSNDPRDPRQFATGRKWIFTIILSLATLSVALASSAYTGAVPQLVEEYRVSDTTAYLGVSLFVVCFAIGPLVWASLSEIFGRQPTFIISFGVFTASNIGAACSKSFASLLVWRFLAGAFGSSSLVHTGAVLADLFPLETRGPPMGVFTASLFLGPTLGPITGSFIGMTQGWRWIEWFLAIMSGVLWIMGSLAIPETYAPALLHKRAQSLSKLSGKVYKSNADKLGTSYTAKIKKTLFRPWVLLAVEPVVFLLSAYLAIEYGILYLLFAAFPVVYHDQRSWTAGVATLPFLAVLVGMLLGVMYCMIHDRRRARKTLDGVDKLFVAEQRLQPATIGAIAIPVGLFIFAWTNPPSVHFMVSAVGTAFFGFGLVNIFISSTSYLIDAYSVFAASSLAASSVLRSIFGAVFPLFTPTMYDALGIHWASSVPAFLSLACIPVPFLLIRYGPWLCSRCKYMVKARELESKLRRPEHGTMRHDAESATMAATYSTNP